MSVAMLPEALLGRKAIVYVRQSTQTHVATRRSKPGRATLPLAERPRSSSMTSTLANPCRRATSTRSYCRRWLSRFVCTWVPDAPYQIRERDLHDERSTALGRRNWLFADTVSGARASAHMYSLVQTARANELEPYAYLCRSFAELPAAQTVEQIEALLPWNIKP